MTDSQDDKARAFAVAAHADQKYGEAPYVTHLQAVHAVLVDFGYSAPFTLAAWLHDVVEDTPVTREEVAANFGDEVAALVWAVTGVGATRPERVHAAYEKIQAHPPAAVLKLADRIANSEASRDYPKKLALYRGEHASFKEHLGTLGDPRMWARLERALGLDDEAR
jgi:(p)ppGpp synthase/HD superfamily hydrolase